MKKSRLAITSFVLALLPIIIPAVIMVVVLITTPGTPIMVQEPLEIVDGEVVGGGEIKDTGRTASIGDISFGRIIGGFGYIFFGFGFF